LALDLPGHGRSPGPACNTIEDYSAAVIAELDHRQIDAFAVAGHSMGAMIALHLAATAPQRVSAAALIGAGLALGVNPALLDGTRDTPGLATRAIVDWGHSFDSHMGSAQTPGLWMDGTDLAVMDTEIAAHPGSLHADFSATASFDGTDLAAAVECPTLVISGQRDNMTPPKLGKAAAEAIANARYVELADAGHMLMTERPAEVAQELRSFFAANA
jgi:pimeloyl-ACP methyl ester carboxylesterase